MPLANIGTDLGARAIGGLQGALSGMLSIQPHRRFESFSNFVSITESHSAQVQTTDYPIEDGSQGTDHIVRQPDAINWEIAFSENSAPQEVYSRLHELMLSGIPFDAVTGLKTYTNMVLLSLSCTQDVHSSRILRISLTMREIIITTAQTTSIPPRDQQASPQMTASTQQSGKKQLEEAGAKTTEQAEETRRKSKLRELGDSAKGIFS